LRRSPPLVLASSARASRLHAALASIATSTARNLDREFTNSPIHEP